MPRHARNILALLVITILAACGYWQTRNDCPDLFDNPCIPGFPAGYAVKATVSVENGSTPQRYFLALESRPQSSDLALFSLQGVPFFRLQCGPGAPLQIHLATVPGAVTPERLVQYLQAIYYNPSRGSLMTAGWRLDQESGVNCWYRHTQGCGIYIRVTGTGPWYKQVALRDDRANLELELRIHEVSLVLPE